MYSLSYYRTIFDNNGPRLSSDLFAMIIIITFITIVLSYIVYSYFLSKIFKKAGQNPAHAWIPILNIRKILEMGDQKSYWAILALIPPFNIAAVIFIFIAMHNIGKKLGKEGWFVLLAIFLSPVWLIWLALDKSKWNDKLDANISLANNIQQSNENQ